MRFTIGGFPTAFYNPLIAFLFLSLAIKTNIDAHQYIPGIFPKLERSKLATNQHVTHHYGSLEPYSVGTKPEYFESDPSLHENGAKTLLSIYSSDSGGGERDKAGRRSHWLQVGQP